MAAIIHGMANALIYYVIFVGFVFLYSSTTNDRP